MAEIKSTMEMVLERAARMAEEASPKADKEEQVQAGMRCGARYMNGEELNLQQEIEAAAPETQANFRLGLIRTLLRNIVLPREEELISIGERALNAVTTLDPSHEVQSVCQELGQILGQYGQHKTQSVQQLDEAIKGQLQQQAMSSGQPAPENLNPAMHPQYKEELSRVLASLNDQYNQAMEQRKGVIEQRFSL